MNPAKSEAETHSQVFPLTRDQRCPFDPPPAGVARQGSGERVARIQLADGRSPWLITGYEEAKSLLSSPNTSSDSSHPGYPVAHIADRQEGAGLSFILMDDPEHARLRRMATGTFTIRRIEALRPKVQAIVDGLIDELVAGPQPADLVERFALPLPSLVICEILGVPYDEHELFQTHSRTIVRRGATPEDQAAAFNALGQYLAGLLERKIEDPGEDLLSDLGARVVAGELERGDAVQMGILLLFAGHETTANMIALGTVALLQHPDQLEKLRMSEDPALVGSAVEELLRYLSIIHDGLKRTVTADTIVGDVTIPAGDGVIVGLEFANRDPKVFQEAPELDLERNPRNHVAFGFGVHQCLGQPLARMELQVVYPTLIRRLPELRLAVPLEQIRFKHDTVIYGVHELPIEW